MNILMTVEELAKYLKIKPDTIYKKVRRGELPAVKLGKLLRFPKELIDQWIIEQAQTTAKAKELLTEVKKRAGAASKVINSDVPEIIEDVKKASLAEKPETLKKGLQGLWTDLNRKLGPAAAPKRKGTGSKKTTRRSVKKNSSRHAKPAESSLS